MAHNNSSAETVTSVEPMKERETYHDDETSKVVQMQVLDVRILLQLTCA